MKTLLITISLLLSLVALQAEEPPARPESFATFWAAFKSAVAKNDREAVAAVTKLPFMGQQAKAAFLKNYPSYFSPEVRKCLETAKPARQNNRDSFIVFCGEEIFNFEKVNGAYKFTSIDMND